MSTERHESKRTCSSVWIFALLAAAPFVAGAKGCDRGVVGDECPDGSATENVRCGTGGGGGGGVDPGTPKDGGSVEPVSCGGIAGKECPDGDYCNFGATCGATDQTGTCEAKPEVCTDIYAPVCGCDGKTYGSACSAAAVGVSVVKTGECGGTTTPPGNGNCGGLLGVQCAKGQYCDFPVSAQCGAADQTGTCAVLPQVCDTLFHAVCGCDGNTYGNACEAAAKGVSVASDGACAATPPVDAGTPPVTSSCGGLKGVTCPTGEYCDFPASTQCGSGDQTGTCAKKSQICNDLVMPVCGCDEKTYPNACYASRAGVSVAKTGECGGTTTPPVGKTCGGLIGATCDKGEYCDFPISAMCGFADATGTCAAIPTGCTKNLAPVCGCDGKTYDNECIAATAGVSVKATGACGGTGTGTSCGSRGLPACASGQFCNFPASAMCGAADAPGTCAPKSQACTEVYAPVCGCDGHTYSNACFANAAGVSVATTGACK